MVKQVMKTKKNIIYLLSIFLIISSCMSNAQPHFHKKNSRLRKKNNITVDFISTQEREKLPYELTYQELCDKKNQYLSFGNREGAIKIIEQMLRLCADMSTLAELILELANILYDDSQFETALTTYKNFMEHYSGHVKFEYALFRAIQCSSRLVLHFDRDQTKTEETIELTEKYLTEECCTVYKTEVERIKDDCLAHLFASELYTIEFYAKTGRAEIAQKRLDHIKDHTVFKTLHNYNSEINRIETEYILFNHNEQHAEPFIEQASLYDTTTHIHSSSNEQNIEQYDTI